MLHRRGLLRGGASLPVATWSLAPWFGQADAAPAATAPTPFDASTVRQMARQLAQQPYKAPDSTLPPELKDLDYSAYRSISFDPAQAL